jgi:hypothetical protein
VIDPSGAVVVEGELGKAAAPYEAIFTTSDGKWQIEAGGSGSVAVLDSNRRSVATARKGEVVLASGERLPWRQSSFPGARYQLGNDLWVAKGGWLPRRFYAEVSPAMLSREDKGLVMGIVSILTHVAVERRRGLLGGASGAGAAWV